MPLESVNSQIEKLNRSLVDENLIDHPLYPRCPATPFFSHSVRRKVNRCRRGGRSYSRYMMVKGSWYDGLHGTRELKKKLVQSLSNAIRVDTRTWARHVNSGGEYPIRRHPNRWL